MVDIRSLISQIPMEPGYVPAPPEPDLSVIQRLMGLPQTLRAVGQNMAVGAASLPVGVYKGFGNPAAGEAAMSQFQQEYGYTPTNPAAQRQLQGLGEFLQQLETEYKIPPIMAPIAATPALGIRGLTPQTQTLARDLVRDIQTTPPTGAVTMGARATQPSPELNLQMAMEEAQKIGLSPDRGTRMLQMGFDPGWYHGTTGDIERFRTDLLGEATGAASAKKGFFFARDPINPPQEMIQKSSDPKAIELLKKAGKTDDEIAELNKNLEPGSGARTASGYSLIGGDREYREAMRKASLAEKKQDWDEYEKQMSIAEDFAIGRMNNSQALVAKYGDARDVMLDKVQGAFFNKQLPQAEAEALDARFRELMPYGWYNQFDANQFETVKQAIREVAPSKQAKEAEKAIDDFIKVKNERTLDEKTQSGSNVLPIALSYKNPLVYDFKGNAYREHKYADLVDEAIYNGNDAVIMLNTYDPGAGKAELVDVGVVFNPNQIRGQFAAFDPSRAKESDILAGTIPLVGGGLLGAEMMQEEEQF
jgi:hypothetical protein